MNLDTRVHVILVTTGFGAKAYTHSTGQIFDDGITILYNDANKEED